MMWRLRRGTPLALIGCLLFSCAFFCGASSGELETSNTELTAFLIESVIGTRELDSEMEGFHSLEPTKSPSRAFLSSLVVPGSGQLYVGAKRGYLFLAADIALLTGYFIIHSRAENTRDDYRDLVREHVIFDGPGTFETWDPIEDFEHATLFDNWHNVYTENDGEPLSRTGKWYWDDRRAFKDESRKGDDDSPNREEALRLRYDANDKFELARTLLGGVILNHAISAVEARIVAMKHNRKNDSRLMTPQTIELDVRTTVLPDGVESQLVLHGCF
ncbi:MAG: hypothetical protein OXN17_17780 [Candidatus Poribacteria bacterium]|nr:hypothetical protein [Candidatus Poribacteria bacterium]MDE0503066.1 hypothetical protein [Candidatus Poribacteria bacterium]